MDKKNIIIQELGRAGPYSHSNIAGQFVFLSGQLGVSKENTHDFEAQFRRAASNVNKVLEGSNSSLKNIVRIVVYIKKQGDFEQMNKLFQEIFQEASPARTTVVCSFPNEDALVELEVTALTN
jgi:2-iminobutanoate/2-iminopropanoate deaminase